MSDSAADRRNTGTSRAHTPGPMVPFAHPFAHKRLHRKIASLITSAATAGVLKRGVKEVVSAIRAGDGSLVVIAGDVRCDRIAVPEAADATLSPSFAAPWM